MTKRKPAAPDAQLGLSFGELEVDVRDGALADLPRATAGWVGKILKEDLRSRYDVSADVSRLADEDVSKMMLDAYASPARDAHRISFDRMLTLVASTGRYDVLRSALARIGCGLLVGEQVFTAELGHLDVEERRIKERRRMLLSVAEPLREPRS